MIVELVSTGSEILLGHLVNTNVVWLSQALNELGYTVAYHSTVGDNQKRMTEVLQKAGERAQLVIVSGGLGATQGDITRPALAKVVRRELQFHEGAATHVKERFASWQREVPTASEREMLVPEGSEILRNPLGVAPGIALALPHTTYILLPGPPGELQETFTNSVIPYLEQRFGTQGTITSRRYAVYGLGETALEAKLNNLVANQQNPTIALLIKKGYIEVRLTAKGKDRDEAAKLLQPWSDALKERLGDAVIDLSKHTTWTSRIGELLTGMQSRIGSAESCTGGLIGKLFTDLPGSSAYYEGGVITYSNALKHKFLSVSQEALDTYGAVSEIVAKQMAEGVCRHLDVDYAVATTGIAGPGGATPTKPVGLVYIGVSGPKGTRVYKHIFIGTRDEVRQSTAEQALQYVYQYVSEVSRAKEEAENGR